MISLTVAQKEADKIIELITPCTQKISIAGSIRRGKPFVKDIEICIIPDTSKLYGLHDILNQLREIKGGSKYQQYVLPSGITLDLFYATPENWGLQLAIRTGSAEFSHHVLACGWVKKGYHSKSGILYDKDEKPTYIREEKDLFDLLELKWITPGDREL